jgi:chromosome segregation ATPase
LYISTAIDDAKNKKWDDAAGELRAANKEVDSALSRKPRLTPEIEALKTAIDRTIGAIERRDKDADAQLSELQVRIGAIKTNIH